MPESLEYAHYKAATSKRNRWMVDQADCLVSYIIRQYGVAYQTYRYAQRKSIPIINVAKGALGKMGMNDIKDLVYDIGVLQIDEAKEEVTLKETPVLLNKREFSALWLLVKHQNENFPREYIHNVLWEHPDPEQGESEINSLIQNLCNKLNLADMDVDYKIVSCVMSRGNRFRFSNI